MAIRSGLRPGAWNGHSFRRRAATWETQVGITDTQIPTLGRWRSDAYKAYVEYSRVERITLSQRFQGGQSAQETGRQPTCLEVENPCWTLRWQRRLWQSPLTCLRLGDISCNNL